MDNNYTCPKCEMENAYFNGMFFVCPDCDYEWSDDLELSEFDTSNDSPTFRRLAELPVPFFTIEQGKLYNCNVHHAKGIENISIIPLASKIMKNITAVIVDARRILNENPNFVYELINTDFENIYNNGIGSEYRVNNDAFIVLCATDNEGTFIDDMDIVYYDFIKTNEI